MVSIVLYGRNDAHGYNLHKRAALGINCMAELLSDSPDEILFVDYNTPDDLPTLPEAIADTLTARAVSRLRVLRVRPAVHERVKSRTHLKVVEPAARNVAIRRSNPQNRWILSTNTDMILVPRSPGALLSDIVADLPGGYYHVPRFEIPESMWEGFDRRNPTCVIEQTRSLGDAMFLEEIVYGFDFIKYDSPGDFQLIAREDLFRIHGFNEDMLLGWHVDSNIAKRLHLMYGSVGDLAGRIVGYHCDHTRQVTPSHQRAALSNDWSRFVEDVTGPELPHQAESWGCAGDDIEEISLSRTAHHVYLESLGAVLDGGHEKPPSVRLIPETFDQSDYDARHVLPFLIDLFASAPRDWKVAWLGARSDTLRMFCDLWERMGFHSQVLIHDWLGPLVLTADRSFVAPVTDAEFEDRANVFVFDFAPLPESAPAHLSHRMMGDFVARRFVEVAVRERHRVQLGAAPRRFICVNALHNRYEFLVQREVDAAVTPFATRLRHGFVLPSPRPPEKDGNAPPDERLDEIAVVREHLRAGPAGRRVADGILAPFGRRGHALQTMPYERLFPGEYELIITLRPYSLWTLAAWVRPVIVEVIGGDGYLVRERVRFFLRARIQLRFSISPKRSEGLEGVEVRLFRGRFAAFVVTGIQIWKVCRPATRSNAENVRLGGVTEVR